MVARSLLYILALATAACAQEVVGTSSAPAAEPTGNDAQAVAPATSPSPSLSPAVEAAAATTTITGAPDATATPPVGQNDAAAVQYIGSVQIDGQNVPLAVPKTANFQAGVQNLQNSNGAVLVLDIKAFQIQNGQLVFTGGAGFVQDQNGIGGVRNGNQNQQDTAVVAIGAQPAVTVDLISGNQGVQIVQTLVQLNNGNVVVVDQAGQVIHQNGNGNEQSPPPPAEAAVSNNATEIVTKPTVSTTLSGVDTETASPSSVPPPPPAGGKAGRPTPQHQKPAGGPRTNQPTPRGPVKAPKPALRRLRRA